MKTSSDRLIDLYVPRDSYHELFWVFGPFYVSGIQETKVTKFLYIFTLRNRPFLDCGLKFFVLCGLPCHTVKVRFLSPKTPRLGDSLEGYWNSGEDDEKEDNVASKYQLKLFHWRKLCFPECSAFEILMACLQKFHADKTIITFKILLEANIKHMHLPREFQIFQKTL